MNPGRTDNDSPVVVDTDVISFVFKNHSLARNYGKILAGRPLIVSLITFAEIEFGMEAARWGLRQRELMSRFLSRFTPLFPDRSTASYWARVRNRCEKKGRNISFSDAWIAATALQLNVPLVTHNVRHFEVVEGLTILTVET
jgi:tRNA(fMet)-specific endonuclease VapC